MMGQGRSSGKWLLNQQNVACQCWHKHMKQHFINSQCKCNLQDMLLIFHVNSKYICSNYQLFYNKIGEKGCQVQIKMHFRIAFPQAIAV